MGGDARQRAAPHFTLEDEAIERALAAMGNFADLISPYLSGHSTGVAELASAAALRCRIEAPAALRRAALVHDHTPNPPQSPATQDIHRRVVVGASRLPRVRILDPRFTEMTTGSDVATSRAAETRFCFCGDASVSAVEPHTLVADDREELALTIAPLLLRAVLGSERKFRVRFEPRQGAAMERQQERGHL